MSNKSLLHYFKPKVVPVASTSVTTDNANENETTIETVEIEDADVPEIENTPAAPIRRSARVSANKAREAWNDQTGYSSSSDEDDFKRGTRKRTRNGSSLRSSGNGRQTTLSRNGSLVSKKDKENNNSKKKVKLDPEREAFLRSGVPDVIEKAKTKLTETSKSKNDSVEGSDTKKRQLDAETVAFLHSGVPESVIKAQQAVEKRREENELTMAMGFFPTTSHVCETVDDEDENIQNESGDVNKLGNFKVTTIETDVVIEDDSTFFSKYISEITSMSQDTTCLTSQESGVLTPIEFCCNENENSVNVNVPDTVTETSSKGNDPGKCNSNGTMPWIDQMQVTNVKDLVVDKNALQTLTKWLKKWKLDIKDDGGASRKRERKKKRGNSSDSDFITSDEEESEMKKKSVLLTGPSGCAKTAAVYVLAKHFGFEVVEVNFSSRRPGKEVLQRVEEAVLSHRVKSSYNCLLLFKDIDLLHTEEDEGFFSAVAQLITTAVRPIVMTSSLPSYCSIDTKLDKKDPLRIPFSLPKPREIVEKILKPKLAVTVNNIEAVKMHHIDKWLDSIVRHCGCDIRQCINQLQLLLVTSKSTSGFKCLSSEDIHLHCSPFQPHVMDLNFPRQSISPLPASSVNDTSQPDDDDDDDLNLSLSARKKQSIRQLNNLSDCLELFGDLDCISHLPSSLPTRNVNIFGDIDEATWYWNHVSGMRLTFFTRLSALLEAQKKRDVKITSKLIRELVLESDTEIDKWVKIDGVNDEIGQYCDRSTTGGNDWESCAAVRTIVKTNMLDSAVGRVNKRNGRTACYFNRLDKRLIANITESFGLDNNLDSVKLYS